MSTAEVTSGPMSHRLAAYLEDESDAGIGHDHHDVNPAAPGSADWAKAPDLRSDPRRLAQVHAATDRDRDHYLRGGLTEIECRSCHGCVMVKKTSEHHTSVQWTAAARDRCSELAAARAAGANPAMLSTCPRLAASIEHGVAEGIIATHSPDSDPDGYW